MADRALSERDRLASGVATDICMLLNTITILAEVNLEIFAFQCRYAQLEIDTGSHNRLMDWQLLRGQLQEWSANISVNILRHFNPPINGGVERFQLNLLRITNVGNNLFMYNDFGDLRIAEGCAIMRRSLREIRTQLQYAHDVLEDQVVMLLQSEQVNDHVSRVTYPPDF